MFLLFHSSIVSTLGVVTPTIALQNYLQFFWIPFKLITFSHQWVSKYLFRWPSLLSEKKDIFIKLIYFLSYLVTANANWLNRIYEKVIKVIENVARQSSSGLGKKFSIHFLSALRNTEISWWHSTKKKMCSNFSKFRGALDGTT